MRLLKVACATFRRACVLAVGRHRIIEQRGDGADGWLRQLDRMDGDVHAFLRYVAIEHEHFYRAALQPRGLVTIPRASVIHETVIAGRRLSIAICRDPKFVLIEELKD